MKQKSKNRWRAAFLILQLISTFSFLMLLLTKMFFGVPNWWVVFIPLSVFFIPLAGLIGSLGLFLIAILVTSKKKRHQLKKKMKDVEKKEE